MHLLAGHAFHHPLNQGDPSFAPAGFRPLTVSSTPIHGVERSKSGVIPTCRVIQVQRRQWTMCVKKFGPVAELLLKKPGGLHGSAQNVTQWDASHG
jgi:hypothetical protein